MNFETDDDDYFQIIQEYENENQSSKDHDKYETALKKLKLVSIISIFFIVVQCIGGYLANSIAIFTDTAHLATDVLGFCMSIIALRLS